ncbi:MAG: hypothetical protein FD146_593 [Anaerolineaceae bacterium]|nr:MAG: hypothetical protein FD146_593 [Anaerolineaceae bacterium]
MFTLAAVLFTYSRASVIASPDQMVRPLLILWGFLVLLAWPAFWIFHEWNRVGFALSFFALLLYYPPDLFLIVSGILAIAFVAWLVYSFVRKRRLKILDAVVLLNITGIILVIFELGAFAPLFYKAAFSVKSRPTPVALVAPDIRPDIYYIVLDGYAREDVLREFFNYDNSTFTNHLRSRGFIIPSENHSNYSKTAASLTSTLNMDYLQNIAPDLNQTPFWWTVTPLLDHNAVAASLEGIGYRTVTIGTDWGITDIPSSDTYFRPYPVILTDYENYLLGATPLKVLQPLLKSVASVPTNDTHRTFVRFSFDTLAVLPDLPGPKFVFAHILSPHPPFVFDASGNPLERGYPFSFNDAMDFPGSRDQYKQDYVGQVEFINAQLEPVIEALLENSEVPPIIILQGDHGSGLLTDFSSADNTCLKERFSPLAAYYLPGLESGDIPDDITPVNLFRIIFNKYFGADLPLLENAEYFNKDSIYIFDTVDVSSRVDETCK